MESKTQSPYPWLLHAQVSLEAFAQETEKAFRMWVTDLVADEILDDLEFVTAVNLFLAIMGGNAINLAYPSHVQVDSLMKWQKKIDLPSNEMRRPILLLLLAAVGKDGFTTQQMVRMVETQKTATIIEAGPSGEVPADPHTRTLGFDPYMPLEAFPGFSESEVSVRTFNGLKNARIRYLGQLLVMTDADILALDQIGRKSLNEVKEILHCQELTLRTSAALYPELRPFQEAHTINSSALRRDFNKMIEHSTVKEDLEREGLQSVQLLLLTSRQEVIKKLGEGNEVFIQALEKMLKKHELRLGMVLPDPLMEAYGW